MNDPPRPQECVNVDGGPDYSFILDQRLAVGGGIWTAEAMERLARRGFTHILNLQAEFDDSELAAAAGMEALWNPTDDDFAPKPPEFFERCVQFALPALERSHACLYVHCAAGMHRGPLAAAAVLCGLGLPFDAAVRVVAAHRIGADFPAPYLDSLREWATARAAALSAP